MKVIGAVFEKPNHYGDFAWMLGQDDYQDALFVFNDNESQFRAFRQNPASGSGCAAGGGNAVIRPYRCQDPPRAAGVPTGHGKGYLRLDDDAKAVIDEALVVIRGLVATGRYGRLFYSTSDTDPDLLGTGIFVVGDDVRRYIVTELRAMSSGLV